MVKDTNGKKSNFLSNTVAGDGTINFDCLEQELFQAAASERRYKLENDTKIKAMENHVEYEQFQALVKTCHLKPLTHNDIWKSLPPKLPFNSCCSKNSDNNSVTVLQKETHLEKSINSKEPKPKTCLEFQKMWNRLETQAAKFLYLQEFSEIELEQFLVADISTNAFVSVLNTMKQAFQNDPQAKTQNQIYHILECFTTAKRFSLHLAFLTDQDKASIHSLFSVLQKSVQNESVSRSNDTRDCLIFDEKDISQLLQKYQLTA
eukprot:Sdes_comp17519_c0_seq1m6752